MADIPQGMPPSPEGVIPPPDPKSDKKDQAEVLRLDASVNTAYVNGIVNYVNAGHDAAKGIHYGD